MHEPYALVNISPTQAAHCGKRLLLEGPDEEPVAAVHAAQETPRGAETYRPTAQEPLWVKREVLPSSLVWV